MPLLGHAEVGLVVQVVPAMLVQQERHRQAPQVAQTVNLDAVRRLPTALVQLRHHRPSAAVLVGPVAAGRGDPAALVKQAHQAPRQQAPRPQAVQVA